MISFPTYTEIDECADNDGGCEHACINTVGSYRCECNPGFTLMRDGLGCESKFPYPSEIINLSVSVNYIPGQPFIYTQPPQGGSPPPPTPSGIQPLLLCDPLLADLKHGRDPSSLNSRGL